MDCQTRFFFHPLALKKKSVYRSLKVCESHLNRSIPQEIMVFALIIISKHLNIIFNSVIYQQNELRLQSANNVKQLL